MLSLPADPRQGLNPAPSGHSAEFSLRFLCDLCVSALSSPSSLVPDSPGKGTVAPHEAFPLARFPCNLWLEQNDDTDRRSQSRVESGKEALAGGDPGGRRGDP